MSSKFIFYGILILSFLAVFILSGCTNGEEGVSDSDRQAVENCNSLLNIDYDAGVRCVEKIGSQIKEITNCDKLQNIEDPSFPQSGQIDFKSTCKIKVATYKKDSTLCEHIASSTKESTEGMKRWCAQQVAFAKGNIGYCDTLKGEGFADEPGVVLFGKENQAREAEILLCKLEFAIYQKDPEVCSQIASSSKDTFSEQELLGIKNTCLIRVAAAKDDILVCEKVQSENGEVGKGTMEFDGCINIIAVARKDEDLCDQISLGKVRDRCFQTIAVANLDPSLCKQMSEEGVCYFWIARRKGDWKVCEQASEPDSCKFQFGTNKRDKEACLQIEEVSLKTRCLLSVLKWTKDESICDDIEEIGEMKKEACLNELCDWLEDTGQMTTDICFMRK